MEFSNLIPWICTSLNCSSVSELSPWSLDELYNYAEEALHAIGGRFLCTVEYDDSIALIADQGTYDLEPLHIATIFAAANGVALKPSTIAEVEALDDNWEEAPSAQPERWIGNVLGLHFICVYPAPDAAGLLNLIYQKHPPDLTAAAPSVLMPAPVGDYLVMRTLERARQRQGEMQMPDVAEALGGVAEIYEQAFKAYYGEGAA